jgi:hypothetical protein
MTSAWPHNPYSWYTPSSVYNPPQQPYVGWGRPNASPNSYYANLPPTGAGSSFLQRKGSVGRTKDPSTEVYQSRRYPALNPTLAVDSTPVRYDVTRKPKDGIPSQVWNAQRHVQATSTPTSHMRLYSKSFPWTVEIQTPRGTMITCEAVWSAMYQALLQPIEDSEWGLLVDNKAKREAIKKAAKERQLDRDSDPWLKRIDWLGSNVFFKGLEYEDSFLESRHLPGTEPCEETWLMKFASSDSDHSWRPKFVS